MKKIIRIRDRDRTLVPYYKTKTFEKRRRKLNGYARKMRRAPTPAERTLAAACRALGLKVYEQQIKGVRIVDVYLPQLDVALEADGAHHFTESGQDYDSARAAYLRHKFPNMTTLRYRNAEIMAAPFFLARLEADLIKAGGLSEWPYRKRV